MTTAEAREQHAQLALAVIAAEANQRRLSDSTFRELVKTITRDLDLPRA